MIKKRLITGWEHYKGSLGGIWEVWRKDKLKNHYNVPWNYVTLPHTYNAFDAVDPDGKYYQGQGWYRTRLEVSNPYPNGRTLLHFEGAGQRADVYVYTKKVGSHIGGYDEFTVDITDEVEFAKSLPLYEGKVPVAVMCDNSRDLETIPSDISDFCLYGGLHRYLNLVYVPGISVEYMHIKTEGVSKEDSTVKVLLKLYNPARYNNEITINFTVKDPAGNIVKTFQYTGRPWYGVKEMAAFNISNPSLWSPDSPNLYSCEAVLNSTLGETSVKERFGLRFFEFIKHGPFMLNGKRLLIQGTQRHDDHAGVGSAMTEEMLVKELNMVKEMGANFLRLGHYQQSRIVLDLCDELGIMVWEEIPWCRGGLGGESYKKQGRDMLKAMINQHYNHPSVIIWGLGNENDWEADFDYFDKEAIREYMSELNSIAHEMDPSRVTGIRRCDFCSDIVDVYSPTLWPGWYGRMPYLDYEKATRECVDKFTRFVHMEWGADNVGGLHAESPKKGFKPEAVEVALKGGDITNYLEMGEIPLARHSEMSETYFCDLVDWILMSQEKMDWLSGTAQWVFKDFATPGRRESPIPYVNIKGVLKRDFTKKEGYYVFQSYWSKKPMVHIYGHNAKIRWGDEGEVKTVKVYSNCTEAELFLNGESCGVKRRNSQDYPAAGLRWDVTFRKGTNKLKAVANKDETIVTDEIEIVYQTDRWEQPERLEVSAIRCDDGKALVEVKAYDKNGIFCADASNFIRFGITGDGKLLDNLGIMGGSRYVRLVNGYASIYVDLQGGKSVVSVSSENFETKFIEV